jgi:hypothetical protein
MHDLIRQLKQNAYHTADRDRCDVETTPEWRAAVELEAWRSVMPQFEFRDGAIHRTLASLPPSSVQ